MKRIITYTITGFICFTLAVLLPSQYKQRHPSPLRSEVASIDATDFRPMPRKAIPAPIKPITQAISKPAAPPKQPVLHKTARVNDISFKTVPFTHLPGWQTANVKQSLIAFQRSCRIFLKKSPKQRVGSRHLNIKAQDWYPACEAALSIKSPTSLSARRFFEHWFHPVEFAKRKPINGLFTGYYMPLIKGSDHKTSRYKTPIYGLPRDLHRRRHYYTRHDIDRGMIRKKAPVIAWIESPVDRLFLEIEGSGVIALPHGERVYLGYAGENGAPYTSIAKILIRKGVLNRDNASKEAIIRYLHEHPQKVDPILHQNQSFVFFQKMKQKIALGAQELALTPGYSLAIDKKWIPLGAPLWLATKKPLQQEENDKKFQRLMIAQDTGGAIRGLMRGDIYWGLGEKAAFLGEHMKNKGRYWLLLPRHLIKQFSRIVN